MGWNTSFLLAEKKTLADMESAVRDFKLIGRRVSWETASSLALGDDLALGEMDGWGVVWIDAEMARNRAERQSWPEVTDCDRLDTVFDTLTNGGILALQNAGCTLSEGREDVAEAYREAGGKRSGITGFCFYHRQDLEEVLKSGELYLAFGAMSGDADEGVEVGRQVTATLQASGFAVEWRGTLAERITVRSIQWQRG